MYASVMGTLTGLGIYSAIGVTYAVGAVTYNAAMDRKVPPAGEVLQIVVAWPLFLMMVVEDWASKED